MTRRRHFKIKLTKKQKRQLAALLMFGLLLWGCFWFYQHYVRFWLQQVTPGFGKPKIVLVIDDIGYERKNEARLRNLGSKVTYAILPLIPYSQYYGNLSRTTHAEVILHLPLDSDRGKIPGRGLIVNEMSDPDVLDMLTRDLQSVPYHVGVNNHMGSRGTANRRMMGIILRELKRRKLFFLDSYTTSASVVPELCRSIGVPFLKRGVFLDNDESPRAIKRQVTELKRLAREKGNAIGIGHCKRHTLEVLTEEIPRMEKEGFEIISLKNLLKIQRD